MMSDASSRRFAGHQTGGIARILPHRIECSQNWGNGLPKESTDA
jgi:hypothetical protein